MRESWPPCRRDTLAVVWPVVAAPMDRASSTATRCPALASRTAVASPVRPAPATTESNPDWPAYVSTGIPSAVSSQSECMDAVLSARTKHHTPCLLARQDPNCAEHLTG